jgi:hypothetical protein
MQDAMTEYARKGAVVDTTRQPDLRAACHGTDR